MIPKQTSEGKHLAAASLLPESVVGSRDTYEVWKNSMTDAVAQGVKNQQARADLEVLEKQWGVAKEVEKVIAKAEDVSEKNENLDEWVQKTNNDPTFATLKKNSVDLRQKMAFNSAEIAKLPFLERLNKIAEYRAIHTEVDTHNVAVDAAGDALKKLLETKPPSE